MGWITNTDKFASLQCDQYSKKEVFGNMCPLLCHHFQLTKCLGKLTGKHVSMVECNGCFEMGKISRIILKGGHGLQTRISQQFTSLTNTTDKFILVRKLVLSMGRHNFGGNLSEDIDIVRYILGEDIHELTKIERSGEIINNVLNLTLKHGLEKEFFSLKVLGPKPFLPKFYGVCGDVYFVEYTPSLVNENYVFDIVPDIRNIKLHLPSWKERVQVALQFLDLVLKVENSYKYPIQICDVKGDNFGINARGELIVLDSDSMRANTVVDQRECHLDEHCNLVNKCYNHCNQTTHTCSPYMVTNNLQNICRFIFLSKWKHLGLLRRPPNAIRKELSELIHECINPREKILKLPAENRSDKKILFALRSLFQQSLRLV